MAIQSSYFDPADGSISTVDLAFTAVRSLKIPLTAATTTDAGAVASVANPEGVPLIILGGGTFRADTGSSGTASLFGGVAESAITSAGGFDVGDANDPSLVNLSAPEERQLWGVTDFFTITTSATLTGLTGGAFYIQYIPA